VQTLPALCFFRKEEMQSSYQQDRYFSQILNFACAACTQNQGFEKNSEGIAQLNEKPAYHSWLTGAIRYSG